MFVGYMERRRVDLTPTVSTFVLVCVFEFEVVIRVRCSMSIQYSATISHWCVVWIHYNFDNGCVFMFLERCRVGPGWSDGVFALVCSWIWNCYLSLIQYEVVISPWCEVKIYYNGDDGCVFVFVECMERCHGDPGRLAGAFILTIWSCYLCSM